MASIVKRGKKYQVKWREPDGSGGWQQRSRTTPDRRTAEAIRREVEQAVALREQWQPDGLREVPDLEVLLRGYIQEKAPSRRPRTLSRYAQHLDIFLQWLRTLPGGAGVLSPTLLSKQRLMAFYTALAKDGRHGRGRNLDTRRRIVQDVMLAWEWMADQEELEHAMPRPRRFEMTRQPETPTLAPTWEEMAACVEACHGWHRQVATLLYYTGLRVGQVMLLRWEDFNLDHPAGPLLTIRGELGKTKHERSGRIVPVSAHLAEELRSWERLEAWLVVSHRARNGPRERVFRARDLGRAWARAGVREAVWTGRPAHCFRKGFITGLKRRKADTEAVEQLVGHRLVGQRGTYLDPDALPMRAAVAKVPAIGAGEGRSLIIVAEAGNAEETG